MADTLKEISDVVGKRVSRLKSKENPNVNVTTMNQLEIIREVIAIADDSRSPTPPDDVGPLNFSKAIEGRLSSYDRAFAFRCG